MALESDATSFAKNSVLTQKKRENENLGFDILAKEEKVRELRKKRLCFAERKRELAEKLQKELINSMHKEIKSIIE